MDILGKTVQRNVLKHAMGVTISMVCVIMDVCLAGVVISAINVLVFSILWFFRYICNIFNVRVLRFIISFFIQNPQVQNGKPTGSLTFIVCLLLCAFRSS